MRGWAEANHELILVQNNRFIAVYSHWGMVAPAFAGVLQNRVTREAGLTRAEPVGDTLIFSGMVRDGSMCWRSGEAAGE
jgi:hypothetical protein